MAIRELDAARLTAVQLRDISDQFVPILTSDPGGIGAGLAVRVVSAPAGAGGGGIAQTQVRDVANVWTDVGYFAGNASMPVNVVAGGAGGGTAQLAVRDATDAAWTNVGPSAARARVPVEAYVGTAAIDPRAIRALTSVDQVTVANASLAVTGTFWQATQPVSGTFWPTTAAAPASQRLSDGAAFYDATKTGQLPSALVGGRLSVDLGATITVPISAASLPLPAGAAQEHVTAAGFHSARLTDGAAFYDARSIRALTSTDVVTANQGTPAAAANRWPVELQTGAATTYDARQIRTLTTGDAITATLAAATDPTKAEDVGHVSGDRGAFVLGVRNDVAVADLTSADLDYSPIMVDIKGRLVTRELSTLYATTISTANAGVTLTIAAAGAGLFHYITSVEITNVNPTAAAIAGSAVTLSYTTTNIPGAPVWTAGNALAAGAEKVVEKIVFYGAVKTTTANTATTFVAPAIGAGGVCRISVTYYIAP